MGKKSKKQAYKKIVGKFVSKNRVMLAALAGAATGITMSGLLGTEKAKKMIDGIEDSVKTFVNNQSRLSKVDEPTLHN